MEGNQLNGLDSAFVAVETNDAHMHMTGLVTLEPSEDGQPAAFEDIRRHLAPRLREIPAFRRHLEEVPLGLDHPIWLERDFELDAHLHHIAVPAPGSSAELADVVGHFAGLPLDRTRPLWDMWFIEGLEEGRTAILTKIHHALIDGVAAAEIFGLLFDADPEAPAVRDPMERSTNRGRDPSPSTTELLLAALRSLANIPFQVARQTVGSTAAATRGLRAMAGASESDEDSALLDAPDTPLNGAITSRRAVTLGSLPLVELRQLKRRFNVKLNDVVLAVCAGALRRYLEDTGDVPDKPLVAAVPVSVAPRTAHRTSGNQVSAMIVDMPVQVTDPVDRLSNIRRSTLRAKHTHGAIGGDLLSSWAEIAPPALLSGVSELYSRLDLADRHRPLVNLIVSNVPGPQVSLYCAGHRIEACHPMGPIFEGCGLNLTVFSYDGQLHFGLLACPDVVPGLGRIAAGLEEAASELHEIAEQETTRDHRRSERRSQRIAARRRLTRPSIGRSGIKRVVRGETPG